MVEEQSPFGVVVGLLVGRLLGTPGQVVEGLRNQHLLQGVVDCNSNSSTKKSNEKVKKTKHEKKVSLTQPPMLCPMIEVKPLHTTYG